MAGTLLPATRLQEGGKKVSIDTPYGLANLIVGEDAVFIQRHGQGEIPPHKINHKANIYAMREYTNMIIGVASVGSLKRNIKPPMILVPDDFLQFDPPTFFDQEIRHVTPAFSEEVRRLIIDAATWNKIKVKDSGVYAQTKGPRLETKAEVRMLSHFADIVGMTVASEATLACELGVKYAAICSVDNLANGLTKNRLDFEDVKENAKRNAKTIGSLLEKLVEETR
jgi:purine nucleoside phosphorylase